MTATLDWLTPSQGIFEFYNPTGQAWEPVDISCVRCITADDSHAAGYRIPFKYSFCGKQRSDNLLEFQWRLSRKALQLQQAQEQGLQPQGTPPQPQEKQPQQHAVAAAICKPREDACQGSAAAGSSSAAGTRKHAGLAPVSPEPPRVHKAAAAGPSGTSHGGAAGKSMPAQPARPAHRGQALGEAVSPAAGAASLRDSTPGAQQPGASAAASDSASGSDLTGSLLSAPSTDVDDSDLFSPETSAAHTDRLCKRCGDSLQQCQRRTDTECMRCISVRRCLFESNAYSRRAWCPYDDAELTAFICQKLPSFWESEHWQRAGKETKLRHLVSNVYTTEWPHGPDAQHPLQALRPKLAQERTDIRHGRKRSWRSDAQAQQGPQKRQAHGTCRWCALEADTKHPSWCQCCTRRYNALYQRVRRRVTWDRDVVEQWVAAKKAEDADFFQSATWRGMERKDHHTHALDQLFQGRDYRVPGMVFAGGGAAVPAPPRVAAAGPAATTAPDAAAAPGKTMRGANAPASTDNAVCTAPVTGAASVKEDPEGAGTSRGLAGAAAVHASEYGGALIDRPCDGWQLLLADGLPVGKMHACDV